LSPAAGIDVGGVEYITDDRDVVPSFTTSTSYRIFVADAPRVIGFNPHVRLVDFLEKQRRNE